MGQSERGVYEQRVAHQLAAWQQEIDQLRAKATERTMPGTAGSEETEVAKLQGQLEMTLVQFDELRAENKLMAWRDLQAGVEQKLAELDETMARTRRHLGSPTTGDD